MCFSQVHTHFRSRVIITINKSEKCVYLQTGVTEGEEGTLTKSIMMMMIMNDSWSETREGNLKL